MEVRFLAEPQKRCSIERNGAIHWPCAARPEDEAYDSRWLNASVAFGQRPLPVLAGSGQTLEERADLLQDAPTPRKVRSGAGTLDTDPGIPPTSPPQKLEVQQPFASWTFAVKCPRARTSMKRMPSCPTFPLFDVLCAKLAQILEACQHEPGACSASKLMRGITHGTRRVFCGDASTCRSSTALARDLGGSCESTVAGA